MVDLTSISLCGKCISSARWYHGWTTITATAATATASKTRMTTTTTTTTAAATTTTSSNKNYDKSSGNNSSSNNNNNHTARQRRTIATRMAMEVFLYRYPDRKGSCTVSHTTTTSRHSNSSCNASLSTKMGSNSSIIIPVRVETAVQQL